MIETAQTEDILLETNANSTALRQSDKQLYASFLLPFSYFFSGAMLKIPEMAIYKNLYGIEQLPTIDEIFYIAAKSMHYLGHIEEMTTLLSSNIDYTLSLKTAAIIAAFRVAGGVMKYGETRLIAKLLDIDLNKTSQKALIPIPIVGDLSAMVTQLKTPVGQTKTPLWKHTLNRLQNNLPRLWTYQQENFELD